MKKFKRYFNKTKFLRQTTRDTSTKSNPFHKLFLPPPKNE